MGATHVKVTVRNPAEPERVWEGEFLVDTGAHNSLVPRKHLEAIGIRPRATKQYELADGAKLLLPAVRLKRAASRPLRGPKDPSSTKSPDRSPADVRRSTTSCDEPRDGKESRWARPTWM